MHFIGIGGAGMSAIARILLAKGITVTGSDTKRSSTTVDLVNLGAKVFIGHDSGNIAENLDEVIISTAIYPDNVELVCAREQGVKILHRSDKLAEIMQGMESIAVAGAHGKTTTTGMAAVMLTGMGLDPCVLVGGDMDELKGNARIGKSAFLVTEADESDGTFLRLYPKFAIVTNIENDHLDYYGSIEKIDEAFQNFLLQLPQDGLAVVSADDEKLLKMSRKISANVLTYGMNPEADLRIENISYQGVNSKSDIYNKSEKVCTLELSVPGLHNITNALAVLAVAYHMGLNMQEAASTLKSFKGVKRRFQIIYSQNDYIVVDDYAHHPTEIKATLKAAKYAISNKLIAVFQPHRFTRTKLLFSEFAKAFDDADTIIITEIYSAGEKPIEGVSARLIIDEIEKSGKTVIYAPLFETVAEHILKIFKPGDMVITLGAGNIYQAGIEVAEGLKKQVS